MNEIKREELLRRTNVVTKWFIVFIVVVFLFNLLTVIFGNDANAAQKRTDNCPGGQSDIQVARYWADSDSTNNWRYGEIDIKAHACNGGDNKLKDSGANLFVRVNNTGEALGYRIYRLPGQDFVENYRAGLVKTYYLYMQYDECIIPIGGGHICNHTTTVRFEVTIYSKKAMNNLGKYAPDNPIQWMWTPVNDRAKDHFELFTTP